MTYVRRCMIVPAAQVSLARELVVLLAGEPAAGMFVTGISPTGDVPFTHYISSGAIEAEFGAVLEDPELMATYCTAAGKPMTMAACGDLLSACDISEDDPFDALTRLGLEMLTEEQLAQRAADRANAAKL